MFNSVLPYYLSLGMTYREFWEEDPWLAEAYRKTNDMLRQRKSEEMWLQGLYIHDAVAVAIGNAFKKKGAKAQKYIEEPIRIVPYTEEEKEIIAERERQKVIEYFTKLEKKSRKAKEK